MKNLINKTILIMELIYDYWKGKPSEVNTSLKRSISQYTRYYSNVKIGITCRPKDRLRQHNKMNLDWEKMIIKYETSSINFINKIEKDHIDYQWEFVTNLRAGGGGPNGKTGPFFLYVLLKK